MRRAQSVKFGTRIFSETVTKVDLSRRPFRIWTDEKEVDADTLIIATGKCLLSLPPLPCSQVLQVNEDCPSANIGHFLQAPCLLCWLLEYQACPILELQSMIPPRDTVPVVASWPVSSTKERFHIGRSCGEKAGISRIRRARWLLEQGHISLCCMRWSSSYVSQATSGCHRWW